MREKLSELEHIQWEKWSKTVAEELMQVYQLLTPIIKDKRAVEARKIVGNRLDRWKKNWKPYVELSEDVKDFDRVWADKVMLIVKQIIEDSFFEGWDDLYGDDFSSNGVVNKEEWDDWWKTSKIQSPKEEDEFIEERVNWILTHLPKQHRQQGAVFLRQIKQYG